MVLVATDVAARGLDIDDIDVVIQQSVLNTDSFIHRTGRTGRAGKSGRNIVLLDVNQDQRGLDFYHKIEKTIKCSFKVSNTITKNHDANDKAVEQKYIERVAKKVKWNADPRASQTIAALSDEANTKVDELMEWFVNLEADSQ